MKEQPPRYSPAQIILKQTDPELLLEVKRFYAGRALPTKPPRKIHLPKVVSPAAMLDDAAEWQNELEEKNQ